MTIRPKDRKLAELILFISERSEGDPPFGADKLAKLLFNADFSAFRMHKKSITGQTYEKCYVCPAPKRLAAVRQALITRGELAIREREPYGSRQYRSFALRLADHSKFTADELAMVTSLIATNWGRSSWTSKTSRKKSVAGNKRSTVKTLLMRLLSFRSVLPPKKSVAGPCKIFRGRGQYRPDKEKA